MKKLVLSTTYLFLASFSGSLAEAQQQTATLPIINPATSTKSEEQILNTLAKRRTQPDYLYELARRQAAAGELARASSTLDEAEWFIRGNADPIVTVAQLTAARAIIAGARGDLINAKKHLQNSPGESSEILLMQAQLAAQSADYTTAEANSLRVLQLPPERLTPEIKREAQLLYLKSLNRPAIRSIPGSNKVKSIAANSHQTALQLINDQQSSKEQVEQALQEALPPLTLAASWRHAEELVKAATKRLPADSVALAQARSALQPEAASARSPK